MYETSNQLLKNLQITQPLVKFTTLFQPLFITVSRKDIRDFGVQAEPTQREIELKIRNELSDFNRKLSLLYTNISDQPISTNDLHLEITGYEVESVAKLKKTLGNISALNEDQIERLVRKHATQLRRYLDAKVKEVDLQPNPVRELTKLQHGLQNNVSENELRRLVKNVRESVPEKDWTRLQKTLLEYKQLAFITPTLKIKATPEQKFPFTSYRRPEDMRRPTPAKGISDYLTEPGWFVDEFGPIIPTPGAISAPRGNMLSQGFGSLLNNALGLGPRLLGRQAAGAVTRGAASTAARGAVGWAAANPVVVAVIAVLVLLIAIPLVQSMVTTGSFLPNISQEQAGLINENGLASGTCPISNPGPILVAAYSGDKTGNYKIDGHGSRAYWSRYAGNPNCAASSGNECPYPLPDIPQPCWNLSCPYYGMAIDVPSADGDKSVHVPYPCPNAGSCDDQEVWWVLTDFNGPGNGARFKTDREYNGHQWTMYLTHMNWVPGTGKGSRFRAVPKELGISDSVGAYQVDHLHFEIGMDSTGIDPTPFCYGGAGAPQGGVSIPAPGGPKCTVPTNPQSYCYIDNASLNPNIRSAFGNEAQNAAITCKRETTSGNPAALNKGCLSNASQEYSVGLFQINTLCHTPPDLSSQLQQKFGVSLCSEGFNWSGACDGKTKWCSIKNNQVVDYCRMYFSDPENNIRAAADIQRQYGWSIWSGARACGIR